MSIALYTAACATPRYLPYERNNSLITCAEAEEFSLIMISMAGLVPFIIPEKNNSGIITK